jgi:subfamily B ATP-binding cassette protein MsbA
MTDAAEPKPTPAKTPVKLVTQDEASRMSQGEFLKMASVPYRRLLAYLKPYRFRFGLGIVLGVAAGGFNAILLMGLKLVFAVVLNEGAPGEPIRPFEDMPSWVSGFELHPPALPAGQQWIWVAGVCTLVPLLILGRGLVSYLHTYCMLWVGNKVLHQLRDDLFTNLMRQSLNFYNRAKTGDLMQTVFNQTKTAQTGATQLASDLIKHPFSMLSIVVVLMAQDWKYTLTAMTLFPACIIPVMMVSKRVRQAGGKEETEAGALMVTMQETFTGIRVVKSYAREEFERDRFNKADLRMQAFMMRWSKALELVGPLVETVASAGIACGLVYAKLVDMGPETFILLNMGLMSIYPHAKALSRIQITLQRSVMATSRVLSLIDQEADIRDAPDAKILRKPKGEIEFKGVIFSYRGSKDRALNFVNAKFEAGKSYALVGRSGSGKSTMLSLIMRFYDPQRGEVLFDGTDVRQIAQASLRDHIGVVNQEVFLFHDTIFNNIRYGDPNATREQVEQAARRAHAHEFILEKPGGYDAVVGEKGCTLSGGQQQRISIARAILRDAPVLLLDEAYSALDSESEKKIHEAMEELSVGKTVIAIAHRLSTILKADEILVMDLGKVVDRGSHSELLERNELYQHLYNLQFRGAELAPPTAASV